MKCDECGFSYSDFDALLAGDAIVTAVSEIAGLLARPGSDVRRRPSPQTWSVIEYGCHVRDVLLVQRERVLLALREERPTLVPMGRDERAEHDGYLAQDPQDVARQLSDAAMLFSNVLHRLSSSDWDRTLIYNYPQTAERSLRWAAVHTFHEVRHHLLDIQRQVR